MVEAIKFLKMHLLILNIVVAWGKAYSYDAFHYCQILIEHHTNTEPNRNENRLSQCQNLFSLCHFSISVPVKQIAGRYSSPSSVAWLP